MWRLSSGAVVSAAVAVSRRQNDETEGGPSLAAGSADREARNGCAHALAGRSRGEPAAAAVARTATEIPWRRGKARSDQRVADQGGPTACGAIVKAAERPVATC